MRHNFLFDLDQTLLDFHASEYTNDYFKARGRSNPKPKIFNIGEYFLFTQVIQMDLYTVVCQADTHEITFDQCRDQLLLYDEVFG